MKIIDLQFLGIPNAIASYLFETSAGPVIMETGPHSTLPNLEKGLASFGYQLADIKHVFLTHIHLDHAGAAWAFAQNGAKIYVHPFGIRHLENPEKLMASAKRIYQDDMDRLWGEMQAIPADQLVAIEHEAIIKIGETSFRALHTPGHAVHHIAWVIGDTIISGDVAGVKIGDGPVVPPCPPPDINIEDWERSIQILLAEAPTSLQLTHYGSIVDVKEHLSALKDELHAWSNWIKPYYLQGKKAAEVTPAFQAFVNERLIKKGVSKSGLQQYEAANPSWMSVAGLMRYWHKKLNK